MTELTPGKPCLIWQEIRDFTRDDGFILPNSCPIEKYCNKIKCIYDLPAQEQTLKDLRAELKEIQDGQGTIGK